MALSAARRDATISARWRNSRKLSIPSWWLRLAPSKGPAFWRRVEAMRKESGVDRSDYSGISYIVNISSRSHQ